jgi:hypothetical protein
MNFTYRGTIGGDSTMQIRLWRQGKKTVAVFDGESRVSRQKRINHDDNFWTSNRPLPKLTLGESGQRCRKDCRTARAISSDKRHEKYRQRESATDRSAKSCVFTGMLLRIPWNVVSCA